MEHLGSEDDFVETVLRDVFTEYTIIVLSSRRVRFAQRTYYLDEGKVS